MVLLHSFYLLGTVNFVHGVVAQDFPGSQPLSRLANGFIVEYADDPQTHSVVSPPLPDFIPVICVAETVSQRALRGCMPSGARLRHAVACLLKFPNGNDQRPSSLKMASLART